MQNYQGSNFKQSSRFIYPCQKPVLFVSFEDKYDIKEKFGKLIVELNPIDALKNNKKKHIKEDEESIAHSFHMNMFGSYRNFVCTISQ